MSQITARFFTLAIAVLFALGCEVTPEKLEQWKGTQNGPKKLASAMIDPGLDPSLRAQAGVNLVQLNEWVLYRKAFQKMNAEDGQTVVAAIAPKLAEMVGQSGEGGAVSKIQVDAKDGLFLLLDYASGEGKKIAEQALIEWCTHDYNKRAMAGQYNIKTIVKKIGAPAADALINLLNLNEIVIKYVAELIRDVKDKTVLEKASHKLAGELKQNVGKIEEAHLLSAAIIGGDAVGQALLDLATDKNISAELQRFSLRAYSESLANESIVMSPKHLETLFAMAENEEYDPYQREETYYVVAQTKDKSVVPRLSKLLSHEEAFYRAVGLRCVLRVDGEGSLAEALSTIAKHTKTESQVGEAIERVGAFPKLAPQIRELLEGKEPFAKGVAVAVLAKVGNKDDAARLNKLSGDKTRLPKGFEHKTLGEAAAAAAKALKQRG